MNWSEDQKNVLKIIGQEESDNWVERCSADAMMEATINMMSNQREKKKKAKL